MQIDRLILVNINLIFGNEKANLDICAVCDRAIMLPNADNDL